MEDQNFDVQHYCFSSKCKIMTEVSGKPNDEVIYDHQPSNVSLEDTQSISSVEYDDWAANRQWWRYMTIMAGSCLWYRHRSWHCWYWWLCYGLIPILARFNWDTCIVEGKHVSTATKPLNAKSNRQCGLPAERYGASLAFPILKLS